METLVAVVGLAAFAALITGLVMVVVNAIRKRRLRVWAIILSSGFLLFILMVAIAPESNGTSRGNRTSDTSLAPTSTSVPALTPTPVPTPTPIPVISITIQELKEKYDANQIVADNRYEGQILEVTGGGVENITRDLFGKPYVSLNTGATFEFWSMTCRFQDEAQILQLRRGETVKIRGKNSGMSFGIVGFDDCEVIE